MNQIRARQVAAYLNRISKERERVIASGHSERVRAIATKGIEGVPKNKTFFERLEWLHANHSITPDIRSWADHVRVEGNAALHDPEEFEEGDAKVLRFFTEMFLRYVFELPGAVREFRGEPNPTP